MSIVQCQNITKTYRQGKVDVTALHGISLDVAEGGFVALAGPSGSGKTTLLNLIGGPADPSAILQSQLEWDLATDWQLIAGAGLYRGDDDTEFGGFYADVDGARVKIGPAGGVYLWLSRYF